MAPDSGPKVWFWTTLLLSCITILSVVFAAWELLEQRFFRNLDFRQLHYLYITRGVASSVVLAAWAVWFVLRERRKAEAELRRSRERYRAMLAHAADAILLLDRELTVLEWNPQAVTLYGYSREEVIGKSLQTLGLAEPQELREILGRLEQGEAAVEMETRRRNRRGEWVDVGLRVSSFQDVGSGQRVLLEMASDLRDKIRLRQKAIEMEKLTSMGRMAAGTAHTLNTPLAAMLLRVEMLREQLGEHSSAAEIARLESSMRFCQEFVQKLLQYGRPSEFAPQRLPVEEFLESVHTFFRPMFQVRRHALTCAGGPLREVSIRADRSQMEALFAALLTNALDALPSTGQGRVVLGGSPQGDAVEFFVSDNGCGIPPERLPHIFEPFYTTKKAGQGTGLGLSIASNIVKDHGGSLALANNDGGGVTVRFRLPLFAGEESSRREPAPPAAERVPREPATPDPRRG